MLDEPMGIQRLTENDIEDATLICNEAIARGESTHGPNQLTAKELFSKIFGIPDKHESYVYQDAGRVIGWAGLTRHTTRDIYSDIYSMTAELDVFVAAEYRGRRIGRSLGDFVLSRAAQVGFQVITLLLQPQPGYLMAAAARRHFRCAGRLNSVLPINGAWRDVYVFQRFEKLTAKGVL